ADRALTDDKYLHARTRKAMLDTHQVERCREQELAQMRLDMVENRQQFAEKCRNFVFKRKACQTPQRLIAPWALRYEAGVPESRMLND
ncbi:formyl transferase, partial [Pseudomonas carnis]|nr:formyl transferase [Pseudomonas carnis]